MVDSVITAPCGPRHRVAARAHGLIASLGPELPLVLFLVAVALVAHGVNMFNAPGIKEDEGTYAMHAWAVLRHGRLTPYTYTYDHAPGGWILAAGWMLLTGGPASFGGPIESARVLMLVLHVATVPLLYRVARKLGCGPAAAGVATLVFTLSPLALAYQRLFLLDNIMVFWLLVSLNLLLDGWGRLSRLVLSGAAFALAVLSKETALFVLPAFGYIAFRQRWSHQGGFGLTAWAVPAGIVTSWYPLYALFKGELLPAGSGLGFSVFSKVPGAKTSLVEAARWQLSRPGGAPLSLHSAFAQLAVHDWLLKDPVLLGIGAAAVAFNLIRGVGSNRRALAAGLLGLLALVYLARGGVVFDFYILVAVPFLALNLGVAASALRGKMSSVATWGFAIAVSAGLVAGYWETGRIRPYTTGDAVRSDREAIAWVKRNVPAASRMIVADDFWAALHENGLGGPAFPNAHSHWKVAADPDVRDAVFHRDWHRVDYLLTTTGLEATFQATGNQVAEDALHHAHVVQSWTAGTGTVALWKVDGAGGTEQSLLAQSAEHLAAMSHGSGEYAEKDGSVTSEAQSYALLRAAWSNDRTAFDQAWGWTQVRLERPDGLLAWQWRGGAVADPNSAADADTDAAYALLVAGKQWKVPAFTAAGLRMEAAIWDHEVVAVRGKPYVVAGNWAEDRQVLALNPSYFSPVAYRLFAELDHSRDWYTLLDSGYTLIDAAAKAPLGAARSSGLPPDWIGMDRSTGQLQPVAIQGRDTTRFGYDAARAFWRVALDYRWTRDGRAGAFLRRAQFLADEVGRKASVAAVYSHAGSIVEPNPSLVATAGAVAALMTIDPAKAGALFSRDVVGAAVNGGAQGTYWGDPRDLYAQEWAWFGIAFYADTLPDIAHAH